MNERQKLAEVLFEIYDHGTQPNALREAEAILARVPVTGVDREKLRKIIAPVLFNAMNYPEPHRILGKSFGKLEAALLDALEVGLLGDTQ